MMLKTLKGVHRLSVSRHVDIYIYIYTLVYRYIKVVYVGEKEVM